MPDYSYRAVDDLIRGMQRVAASTPDPMHILAETIALIGEIDVDPYAVLGVLIEGMAHTLKQYVSLETQADTAATLMQLLDERLKACGSQTDPQYSQSA